MTDFKRKLLPQYQVAASSNQKLTNTTWHYSSQTATREGTKTGVGNLRPAGRIQPAKQNHPARDILLKYYRIRPTVSFAILDFDEFQQSMRQ